MLQQAGPSTRSAVRGSRCSTAVSCRGRRRVLITCSAQRDAATRRAVLLGGGAMMAVPFIDVQPSEAAKKYLPVENLSSFQKNDQRIEYAIRAQTVLKEVLTGADAPAAVRLALRDAGTYSYAAKLGGFDGSIATNSSELEAAGLQDLVSRLAAAKARIDEGDKTGAGPISWADTIYLAGKVATQQRWADIKMSKSKNNGKFLAEAFRNPWAVELGRIDSAEPGPNPVPAPGAPVEEVTAFLSKLGAKPDAGSGPFSAKPPFWERPGFLIWTAAADDPEAEEQRFVKALPDVYASIKRSYDVSRNSITRTDYEVDFAAVYNKLASLGAKFNSKAYLYPVPVNTV